MEAIIRPAKWANATFAQRLLFKRMRHPVKGERMIIKKNFFIKRLLPMMVVRKLTAQEKAAYNAPFLDPATRAPIAQWSREIPFDGDPADNHEMINAYWAWLQRTEIPKLLLWAKPGALMPPSAAAGLGEALPNLESVFIGRARHYVQEDQPDAIGEALSNWLARLPTLR